MQLKKTFIAFSFTNLQNFNIRMQWKFNECSKVSKWIGQKLECIMQVKSTTASTGTMLSLKTDNVKHDRYKSFQCSEIFSRLLQIIYSKKYIQMSDILVNFRDQYCNADWFYNDFYANDLHINVDKIIHTLIHNQDIYKYNRFVLQLYINKSTSVCFKLSSLLFWLP